MAKEKLEFEISAKDDASKVVDPLQKKVDKLESGKTTVKVGADAKKAISDVDAFAAKIEKLSAEDQVVLLSLKAAGAQSELTQLATELADIDSSDPTVEVKLEQYAQVAGDLDQLQAKIKAVADTPLDTGGLGGQLTGVKTKLEGMRGEADQSRSVLANMVGNSAQDLGQLGGVAGTTGVALGQLAEYAADGNIKMANLATVGLGLGGIAGALTIVNFAMGQLADEAKQVAAIKAFKAEEVKAYSDALRDQTSVYDELKKRIEDTGQAVFIVNSSLDSFSPGIQSKLDIADVLARNGVTLGQFSTAVEGGGAGVERFEAALRSAGISGDDLTKIVSAARNETDLYSASQKKHEEITRVLAGTTSDWTGEAQGALDVANGLIPAFNTASTSLNKFGKTWNDSRTAVEDWAGEAGDASLEAAHLAAATDDANKAAEKASLWASYAAQLSEVEDAATAAARSQDEFRDGLAKVADDASGSLRANLALDSSYADLRQSFKDNGKSVDQYTEKGRNNIAAILATGDAIRNNLSQQLKDSGGDYEQVKRAAGEYTDQLSAQLKQAGLTKDQIAQYIQTLGLTPEQVETAIKLSGQAEAKSKLDTLNVDLDTFDGETRTAYVEAISRGDYETALGIIKAVTSANNKTVTYTVTTNYKTTGDLSNAANRDFHGVGQSGATGIASAKKGAALVGEEGTEIVAGKYGAYLVGEDGPEVVSMRGGERVYTAAQTAAILSGGAGTGPGQALPGYASGVGFGGTYDASQVTVVSTKAAPAASGAAVSADDVVAEQDRIQAAMYETGRISLAAYRQYAQGRLAQSADLSSDWLTQYRLIKSLNADEAQSEQDKADAVRKAADDQIAAQDDLQKNMFDLGVITAQQYKDYLATRIGSFQQFSDGYTAIFKQMKQLSDQEVADQKANTKALYDQAQAQRNASEAGAAQADAFNDVQVAGAAGARIQKDRTKSAEDKAKAVQDLIDSETKLADSTYKAVLSNATAAGLDVGSVPWDRFVRAALSDYIGQFAGLPYTTGPLQSYLSGIPALATGGTVKGTATGTLALIAEGGKTEHVVRDDPLQELTHYVAALARQPRSNVTINTHAGMTGADVVQLIKRGDRRNGTASGRRPTRVAVGG